jgi:hypothetical protein
VQQELQEHKDLRGRKVNKVLPVLLVLVELLVRKDLPGPQEVTRLELE